MKRNLAAVLSFAVAGLLLGSGVASAQITLGTAQNFAVLGGSSVSNTGSSVINGNVGVSPGSSVTGFPPGLVTGGAIQSNNAVAAQAQSDLTTAYTTASGTACTTDLTGQDLGTVGALTPGVYCFSASAALTGTLTLDFLGDPNALFLFKVGSTLTTASGSTVVVTNAGGVTCPPNVFWQVGSSATLGTGSSFVGNILALTSITLTTGASLQGRTLARNGAVTLDTNTVSLCALLPTGAAVPLSPTFLVLMSLGLAVAAVITLRH
jgi:hypothetical protein